MPAISEHLSSVETNLEAYDAIPGKFAGWRAVVVFYAAVHLIEAMLANSGEHTNEHTAREREIKNNHGSIWKQYSRLKQESMKARYMCPTVFSLTEAQVHEQLRKKCIRKIMGYVNERLPAEITIESGE